MKQHMFAVCAYGKSPYLEACIRSLKRQSVQSHIILCTSTPSRYLDNLAARYQIRLFVRDGISNIQDDWNFAYHMADARFVTIAHQDDIYHKEYVRCLLEQYEKYPDMSLFCSGYSVIKNGKLLKFSKVELIKRFLRIPLRTGFFNHLTIIKKLPLRFGNSICCPSCGYHKKYLKEPLFTSTYEFALDWDTLLKLARHSGRFVCVEQPLIYYRVHHESATKVSTENKRREQEEQEIFRKLWPDFLVNTLMYFYSDAYSQYEETEVREPMK